jgi:hypothetical protein
MMNFKFERMRKKEVVIFYLLTRNIISRSFLQHSRVVAIRVRKGDCRLSQVAIIPWTYTGNLYCAMSPGYLLCPMRTFTFLSTALGPEWWCRCDMEAHPKPSRLCTWKGIQHHPLLLNHELAHFARGRSANRTIILVMAFRNLILGSCSSLYLSFILRQLLHLHTLFGLIFSIIYRFLYI